MLRKIKEYVNKFSNTVFHGLKNNKNVICRKSKH